MRFSIKDVPLDPIAYKVVENLVTEERHKNDRVKIETLLEELEANPLLLIAVVGAQCDDMNYLAIAHKVLDVAYVPYHEGKNALEKSG